jgi:hypothetical protein
MPGRDVPQTAAGWLALDRDPPRFRRLMFGQVQLQDTIFHAGLDLVDIHRSRQRERALEAAVSPFPPLVVRLGHAGRWLALPA